MHHHRGNILFLILLAVVLLAALAYAVTSSMRGGGKDAASESADAKASQLLNYFAEIDSAVQRMMLVGDVKDYQVNFLQSPGPQFIYGNNDNTNCTEARCRVFNPAGGGVTGRLIPANYLRSGAHATTTYPRIVYEAVAQNGMPLKQDIVMDVPGIDWEICKAINKKFGYDGIIMNAPTYTGPTYQHPVPVGEIPSSASAYGATTVPAAALNAGTFCVCNGDQATCEASAFHPSIRHVIIAR